ncbi:MAG: DNA photolyase family protein [Halothiobacillaceae bacterium]
MHSVQVVWFKRDLRVHDHRPLREAAARGPVVPIYIVEPGLWRQADASPRQWAFVRHSLMELDQALRALGGGSGGLVVRVGEVVEVLETLRRELAFEALWSHQETGNAWTFQRDRAVARWAASHNIPWHEFQQDGVIRRLATRNGWAERWASFMEESLHPTPAQLTLCAAASVPLPVPQELFDAPEGAWRAQPGGRAQGLRLLDSFLHVRGLNYARGMSSPLTAETACSRLSPHIAYGTLSMREIVHALRARRQTAPSGWGRALAAFESRLAWRSHFMQKLESEPRMEFENLHPALAGARQTTDPCLFEAWRDGQTGFPLIDACMRMLHATGWINFRMRAMLAAFASYHLWQPWRAAGLHLARLFIDYEPGIHWSQMQMQSGSTGINAFRIYNPVKQSRDQDPRGVFIRRWLPELGLVPDDWIHEPWRMPATLQRRYGCVIGRDYPHPVVDHELAARQARERVHAAYASDEARHASRKVFERHGSRKTRSRPATGSTPPQLRLFD